MTATGKTVGENLASIPESSMRTIIASRDEPFAAEGGLSILLATLRQMAQ